MSLLLSRIAQHVYVTLSCSSTIFSLLSHRFLEAKDDTNLIKNKKLNLISKSITALWIFLHVPTVRFNHSVIAHGQRYAVRLHWAQPCILSCSSKIVTVEFHYFHFEVQVQTLLCSGRMYRGTTRRMICSIAWLLIMITSMSQLQASLCSNVWSTQSARPMLWDTLTWTRWRFSALARPFAFCSFTSLWFFRTSRIDMCAIDWAESSLWKYRAKVNKHSSSFARESLFFVPCIASRYGHSEGGFLCLFFILLAGLIHRCFSSALLVARAHCQQQSGMRMCFAANCKAKIELAFAKTMALQALSPDKPGVRPHNPASSCWSHGSCMSWIFPDFDVWPVAASFQLLPALSVTDSGILPPHLAFSGMSARMQYFFQACKLLKSIDGLIRVGADHTAADSSGRASTSSTRARWLAEGQKWDQRGPKWYQN